MFNGKKTPETVPPFVDERTWPVLLEETRKCALKIVADYEPDIVEGIPLLTHDEYVETVRRRTNQLTWSMVQGPFRGGTHEKMHYTTSDEAQRFTEIELCDKWTRAANAKRNVKVALAQYELARTCYFCNGTFVELVNRTCDDCGHVIEQKKAEQQAHKVLSNGDTVGKRVDAYLKAGGGHLQVLVPRLPPVPVPGADKPAREPVMNDDGFAPEMIGP